MVQGKRGDTDLYWKFVSILLVIVAFLILAYFVIRLNVADQGKDALCKLSLLGKATLPNVPLIGGGANLPAECETNKICLGGDCEDNFGKNEEPNKISLSSKNINKSVEKIEQTIAEEFYKCWDKTGRGKFDLFGKVKDDANARCLVCSRIAFDKNLDPEVTNNVNINNYLATHGPASSELNYLESMGLRSDSKLRIDTIQASNIGTYEASGRKTNEAAIVFMQISADELFEDTGKILGVGAAGAFVAYNVPGAKKFLIPIGRAVAKTGTRGGVYGVLIAAVAFTGVELDSYFDRTLVAGYCGDLQNPNGSKTSTGCSLIQIVPYNKDSINSICDIVEGDV